MSLIVNTGGEDGVVALAGDTFEREEDIWEPAIWRLFYSWLWLYIVYNS